MACTHCAPFAEHFVIRGRCNVKWRGKSFDADQALGNIGLALMQVLGYPPSGFLEFSKHVKVTPFREATQLNPASSMGDGGEWWDYHVALRDPLEPGALVRLREAGRRALDKSRNFSEARVLEAAP